MDITNRHPTFFLYIMIYAVLPVPHLFSTNKIK